MSGKTIEQAMLEMDMADHDGVICYIEEFNRGCDCCDSDWQTFFTPATVEELLDHAAELSAHISDPEMDMSIDAIEDDVSEIESIRIIVDEMNRRAEAADRVHNSLTAGWL